ncbi:NAD(P)/FAD-dependent oxidoreductase [Herbiconiux sp. KACC 21604]|uniref:flavin-containing monooxygenase n=1 Tax=unclassified Herbiconiux TaxID=2618217 RepID=UPI001491A25C|nr:NAD(P)/FAD-dependent oxidoreductase [Herbiconiux sp. SALV-R1]QJU54780.1 NAD(P)/FAD-dependent oxidoreductase [Herbiconiux sp. SALV-R1]WPO85889.1 NAD(P)/FAD-dependent oxidoreductase [Herbiconiux sp. KACC 21604]
MTSSSETLHVDVIVVGAGISGIGAAHHLAADTDRDFIVLDSNSGVGGTWWTHRYPGARSDSDLFQYGFGFKPWTGAPIARRDEILAYLNEAVDEAGFREALRLGHEVISAEWSSADTVWAVRTRLIATGEIVVFTCTFLWMCQGYYRHSTPNQPIWEGMDDFRGEIVHPQHWPPELAIADREFVVVGSGATAATIVPALAREGAHVTMLQRSPTYFIPIPNVSATAEKLRALDIPAEWIHEICRREGLAAFYAQRQWAVAHPDEAREALLRGVRDLVGEETTREHFTPRYAPMTQRPVIVPDGDFFAQMNEGRVGVVTEAIERFVPEGILTVSGRLVEADVVVTATGFDMNVLGDVRFVIDGEDLRFHESITYLGMLFTGVPNMVWTMSHYNAPWTLRADLVSQFVVRLLNHMREQRYERVDVAPAEEESAAELREWIDTAVWSPGYWLRGLPLMPKNLGRAPWYVSNDIMTDLVEIPAVDLEATEFRYSAGRRADVRAGAARGEVAEP